MHRIALNAPEEDELLLLHVWVTLMIWLYSGILEEAERYTYFDSAVSDEEKEYIMGFYKKCLQRHIYTRGTQDKHYLSKNPAFTPKIDALYEFFPDAKIIYLVRNPLNSIPSYISLMDFTWRVMGDPQEEYASREYVLDMAKHWYEYPIDRLEEAPEESYAVVNFHDMVSNPRDIATALYEHFELPLSEAYDETLIVETEKARNYTSQHNYSLDELGLTREQILAEFEDVFELFGFDPQGPVDWASATADGHHAKDMSEKKHRKKKRRLRRSKLGLSVLG
jgi:hypothetical protein